MKRSIYSAIGILVSVGLCHPIRATGTEVSIKVVNESGLAVPGANVRVVFEGFATDGSKDLVINKATDHDGRTAASGKADYEIRVDVNKDGHYGALLDHLSFRIDHDLTVVLPRILNPISLRALAPSIGGLTPQLKLPLQNEWLGFDFEVGDWVTPHGKGMVTDIRFRFRNEFKGYKDRFNLKEEVEYAMEGPAAAQKQVWSEERFKERVKLTAGKWDAELEISFPGEKEGMFEVKEGFLLYSKMKMPHEAPADGYVPTWRYEAKSYSPPTTRKDAGFFLRTRVKLDKDGNILSAHYSKVMGDFYVFAPGGFSFTYYFNPKPNDRNLEFDPKKNLFPKDFQGAHVSSP